LGQELATVPAFACLQHLSWLVTEVEVLAPDDPGVAGPIEDHTTAIRLLLTLGSACEL
jgi:hypothetical protein